MKPTIIECLECSKPTEKRRSEQTFCCTSCRQKFNNRRMQRGAEIYDLFRSMRRERGIASELGIWAQMCRLEKTWNDEDGGKKTWVPPHRALQTLENKGSIPRGEVLCRSYMGGKSA